MRGAEGTHRKALVLRGAVQGVGLRPFVRRAAGRLGVAGFVRNVPAGVEIEAEGSPAAIEALLAALRAIPSPARIDAITERALAPIADEGFFVRDSAPGAAGAFPLGPDLATCAECMAEVLDPGNRRFRHPFASCTRCGPRWSIATALPWDRARTSMAAFAPCARCRAEYEDPDDARRFHAQTLACPHCGPQLALRTRDGSLRARGDAALAQAIHLLRAGGIVAVLGLGGYQLLVDARDDAAVARLRKRKGRPHKPLALAVADARGADALVDLGPSEREAFASAAGPIVLARRRPCAVIADAVAGDLVWLGVMRATTPLHRLLLDGVGGPLVATSGNRSGEPLCANDAEALACLSEVADVFLTHDRAVVRAIDDSVVREIGGRVVTLRCARGLAPLALPRHCPAPPRLALGGDLKAAAALASGDTIVLGPHVGDLGSPRASDALRGGAEALCRFMGAHGAEMVADAHPDTQAISVAEAWTRWQAGPPQRVHHHHAHVLSCVAEHDAPLPVLGVAWDGAGFGPDRGAWGGEILRVDEGGATRVAHLRRFRLPGGDAAAREPRRAAVGLLFARFGEDALARDDVALRGFDPSERAVLARVLRQGRFAPETSSAGRLFDAIASLLDVRQRCSYEGQAALELEALATRSDAESEEAYPMPCREGVLDWAPLLARLLDDRDAGANAAGIALRFHRGLACAIVEAVSLAAERTGIRRVVLSGGCFQNALLSTFSEVGLRRAGLEVLRHGQVPPNDGGLALGQIRALDGAVPQSGE